MNSIPDTCVWMLNSINLVQPKLLAEAEFGGLSWGETMALRVAVSSKQAELQWLIAELCEPWFDASSLQPKVTAQMQQEFNAAIEDMPFESGIRTMPERFGPQGAIYG